MRNLTASRSVKPFVPPSSILSAAHSMPHELLRADGL
jgi:hypothetical protein